MSAARGYLCGPAEGEARQFFDHVMVTKVSGTATDRHVAVIEATAPAGSDVPAHSHSDGEHEMFYVLEGELEVFCGPDRWTATPGSLVFLPYGVEHGYRVTGGTDARFLIIVGPAGFDQHVAEAGTLLDHAQQAAPPAPHHD